MLDVERRARRHINALSGDPNFEAFAVLDRVGEPPQLLDELIQRVILLDVAFAIAHGAPLGFSGRPDVSGSLRTAIRSCAGCGNPDQRLVRAAFALIDSSILSISNDRSKKPTTSAT